MAAAITKKSTETCWNGAGSRLAGSREPTVLSTGNKNHEVGGEAALVTVQIRAVKKPWSKIFSRIFKGKKRDVASVPLLHPDSQHPDGSEAERTPPTESGVGNSMIADAEGEASSQSRPTTEAAQLASDNTIQNSEPSEQVIDGLTFRRGKLHCIPVSHSENETSARNENLKNGKVNSQRLELGNGGLNFTVGCNPVDSKLGFANVTHQQPKPTLEVNNDHRRLTVRRCLPKFGKAKESDLSKAELTYLYVDETGNYGTVSDGEYLRSNDVTHLEFVNKREYEESIQHSDVTHLDLDEANYQSSLETTRPDQVHEKQSVGGPGNTLPHRQMYPTGYPRESICFLDADEEDRGHFSRPDNPNIRGSYRPQDPELSKPAFLEDTLTNASGSSLHDSEIDHTSDKSSIIDYEGGEKQSPRLRDLKNRCLENWGPRYARPLREILASTRLVGTVTHRSSGDDGVRKARMRRRRRRNLRQGCMKLKLGKDHLRNPEDIKYDEYSGDIHLSDPWRAENVAEEVGMLERQSLRGANKGCLPLPRMPKRCLRKSNADSQRPVEKIDDGYITDVALSDVTELQWGNTSDLKHRRGCLPIRRSLGRNGWRIISPAAGLDKRGILDESDSNNQIDIEQEIVPASQLEVFSNPTRGKNGTEMWSAPFEVEDEHIDNNKLNHLAENMTITEFASNTAGEKSRGRWPQRACLPFSKLKKISRVTSSSVESDDSSRATVVQSDYVGSAEQPGSDGMGKSATKRCFPLGGKLKNGTRKESMTPIESDESYVASTTGGVPAPSWQNELSSKNRGKFQCPLFFRRERNYAEREDASTLEDNSSVEGDPESNDDFYTGERTSGNLRLANSREQHHGERPELSGFQSTTVSNARGPASSLERDETVPNQVRLDFELVGSETKGCVPFAHKSRKGKLSYIHSGDTVTNFSLDLNLTGALINEAVFESNTNKELNQNLGAECISPDRIQVEERLEKSTPVFEDQYLAHASRASQSSRLPEGLRPVCANHMSNAFTQNLKHGSPYHEVDGGNCTGLSERRNSQLVLERCSTDSRSSISIPANRQGLEPLETDKEELAHEQGLQKRSCQRIARKLRDRTGSVLKEVVDESGMITCGGSSLSNEKENSRTPLNFPDYRETEESERPLTHQNIRVHESPRLRCRTISKGLRTRAGSILSGAIDESGRISCLKTSSKETLNRPLVEINDAEMKANELKRAPRRRPFRRLASEIRSRAGSLLKEAGDEYGRINCVKRPGKGNTELPVADLGSIGPNDVIEVSIQESELANGSKKRSCRKVARQLRTRAGSFLGEAVDRTGRINCGRLSVDDNWSRGMLNEPDEPDGEQMGQKRCQSKSSGCGGFLGKRNRGFRAGGEENGSNNVVCRSLSNNPDPHSHNTEEQSHSCAYFGFKRDPNRHLEKKGSEYAGTTCGKFLTRENPGRELFPVKDRKSTACGWFSAGLAKERFEDAGHQLGEDLVSARRENSDAGNNVKVLRDDESESRTCGEFSSRPITQRNRAFHGGVYCERHFSRPKPEYFMTEREDASEHASCHRFSRRSPAEKTDAQEGHGFDMTGCKKFVSQNGRHVEEEDGRVDGSIKSSFEGIASTTEGKSNALELEMYEAEPTTAVTTCSRHRFREDPKKLHAEGEIATRLSNSYDSLRFGEVSRDQFAESGSKIARSSRHAFSFAEASSKEHEDTRANSRNKSCNRFSFIQSEKTQFEVANHLPKTNKGTGSSNTRDTGKEYAQKDEDIYVAIDKTKLEELELSSQEKECVLARCKKPIMTDSCRQQSYEEVKYSKSGTCKSFLTRDKAGQEVDMTENGTGRTRCGPVPLRKDAGHGRDDGINELTTMGTESVVMEGENQRFRRVSCRRLSMKQDENCEHGIREADKFRCRISPSLGVLPKQSEDLMRERQRRCSGLLLEDAFGLEPRKSGWRTCDTTARQSDVKGGGASELGEGRRISCYEAQTGRDQLENSSEKGDKSRRYICTKIATHGGATNEIDTKQYHGLCGSLASRENSELQFDSGYDDSNEGSGKVGCGALSMKWDHCRKRSDGVVDKRQKSRCSALLVRPENRDQENADRHNSKWTRCTKLPLTQAPKEQVPSRVHNSDRINCGRFSLRRVPRRNLYSLSGDGKHIANLDVNLNEPLLRTSSNVSNGVQTRDEGANSSDLTRPVNSGSRSRRGFLKKYFACMDAHDTSSDGSKYAFEATIEGTLESNPKIPAEQTEEQMLESDPTSHKLVANGADVIMPLETNGILNDVVQSSFQGFSQIPSRAYDDPKDENSHKVVETGDNSESAPYDAIARSAESNISTEDTSQLEEKGNLLLSRTGEAFPVQEDVEEYNNKFSRLTDITEEGSASSSMPTKRLYLTKERPPQLVPKTSSEPEGPSMCSRRHSDTEYHHTHTSHTFLPYRRFSEPPRQNFGIGWESLERRDHPKDVADTTKAMPGHYFPQNNWNKLEASMHRDVIAEDTDNESEWIQKEATGPPAEGSRLLNEADYDPEQCPTEEQDGAQISKQSQRDESNQSRRILLTQDPSSIQTSNGNTLQDQQEQSNLQNQNFGNSAVDMVVTGTSIPLTQDPSSSMQNYHEDSSQKEEGSYNIQDQHWEKNGVELLIKGTSIPVPFVPEHGDTTEQNLLISLPSVPDQTLISTLPTFQQDIPGSQSSLPVQVESASKENCEHIFWVSRPSVSRTSMPLQAENVSNGACEHVFPAAAPYMPVQVETSSKEYCDHVFPTSQPFVPLQAATTSNRYCEHIFSTAQSFQPGNIGPNIEESGDENFPSCEPLLPPSWTGPPQSETKTIPDAYHKSDANRTQEIHPIDNTDRQETLQENFDEGQVDRAQSPTDFNHKCLGKNWQSRQKNESVAQALEASESLLSRLLPIRFPDRESSGQEDSSISGFSQQRGPCCLISMCRPQQHKSRSKHTQTKGLRGNTTTNVAEYYNQLASNADNQQNNNTTKPECIMNSVNTTSCGLGNVCGGRNTQQICARTATFKNVVEVITAGGAACPGESHQQRSQTSANPETAQAQITFPQHSQDQSLEMESPAKVRRMLPRRVRHSTRLRAGCCKVELPPRKDKERKDIEDAVSCFRAFQELDSKSHVSCATQSCVPWELARRPPLKSMEVPSNCRRLYESRQTLPVNQEDKSRPSPLPNSLPCKTGANYQNKVITCRPWLPTCPRVEHGDEPEGQSQKASAHTGSSESRRRMLKLNADSKRPPLLIACKTSASSDDDDSSSGADAYFEDSKTFRDNLFKAGEDGSGTKMPARQLRKCDSERFESIDQLCGSPVYKKMVQVESQMREIAKIITSVTGRGSLKTGAKPNSNANMESGDGYWAKKPHSIDEKNLWFAEWEEPISVHMAARLARDDVPIYYKNGFKIGYVPVDYRCNKGMRKVPSEIMDKENHDFTNETQAKEPSDDDANDDDSRKSKTHPRKRFSKKFTAKKMLQEKTHPYRHRRSTQEVAVVESSSSSSSWSWKEDLIQAHRKKLGRDEEIMSLRKKTWESEDSDSSSGILFSSTKHGRIDTFMDQVDEELTKLKVAKMQLAESCPTTLIDVKRAHKLIGSDANQWAPAVQNSTDGNKGAFSNHSQVVVMGHAPMSSAEFTDDGSSGGSPCRGRFKSCIPSTTARPTSEQQMLDGNGACMLQAMENKTLSPKKDRKCKVSTYREMSPSKAWRCFSPMKFCDVPRSKMQKAPEESKEFRLLERQIQKDPGWKHSNLSANPSQPTTKNNHLHEANKTLKNQAKELKKQIKWHEDQLLLGMGNEVEEMENNLHVQSRLCNKTHTLKTHRNPATSDGGRFLREKEMAQREARSLMQEERKYDDREEEHDVESLIQPAKVKV